MQRFTFSNEANKYISFVLISELQISREQAFEMAKPWIERHAHDQPPFPRVISLRLSSDGQVTEEASPDQ